MAAPQVTPEELALRQRLKDDFEFYAPRCLKILDKAGRVASFSLNESQRRLHEIAQRQLKEKGWVRLLVLKGRQQGISTYVEGRFYWKVSHKKGTRAYILTHEDKATANLFAMVRRYHEHCPPKVRPHTSNSSATELVFDILDSRYGLGTAKAKATGRGATPRFFHGSEVAFWPMAQTHMAGILQGVPSGDEAMGTEIILESTANGVSGDGKWFYENCQAARSGDSDFELVFLPWFLEPGYRRKPPEGWEPSADEWEYASIYGLAADQLYWRNRKIQEMGGGDAGGRLFCQEYPANIDEAYLSEDDTALIRAESILEAMQRRPAEHAYGPLLIGVDPARYGDDKTAIVIRQGRRVHSVKRIGNASTMHVVGIIFRLIQELHPARVFVDEIGIGAGIVDRLRELGFGSITSGVNSASKALEHDKYYNRRAEMNVRMRDWLERDEPTLPSEKDAPTLLRDLAGIYYKYDSNGRYQLLLKEEIKKRLGWSPDAGDALALTFAAPVSMFAAETFEPGSAMTRQESALLAMESFEPPE